MTHHTLSIKEVNYLIPLYLYPQQGERTSTPRVNLDPATFDRIRHSAGLSGPSPGNTISYRSHHATGESRPDEVKVFDYIYGILHCPAYRETYAQFLKADFPRIPFPPSPQVFKTVSEHGETLRRLHLMEDAAIGTTPYPFHGEGNSIVDKPRFAEGCVWINEGQYFTNVPNVAWDFPIGGYKPAQKWLKDRKGRALCWDDIRHYQRIIKILAETDRIMRLIVLHDET
jgi:predicted helicase